MSAEYNPTEKALWDDFEVALQKYKDKPTPRNRVIADAHLRAFELVFLQDASLQRAH